MTRATPSQPWTILSSGREGTASPIRHLPRGGVHEQSQGSLRLGVDLVLDGGALWVGAAEPGVQRTCSSLTLGSRPLNASVVSRSEQHNGESGRPVDADAPRISRRHVRTRVRGEGTGRGLSTFRDAAGPPISIRMLAWSAWSLTTSDYLTARQRRAIWLAADEVHHPIVTFQDNFGSSAGRTERIPDRRDYAEGLGEMGSWQRRLNSTPANQGVAAVEAPDVQLGTSAHPGAPSFPGSIDHLDRASPLNARVVGQRSEGPREARRF